MRMPRLIVFAIALLLLAGCNLNSQPQPTPTEPAVSATATVSPTLAPTEVDPQMVQNRYENPEYGFAFTYSGLWVLEELPAGGDSANRGLRLSMDSIVMEIEYGYVFEFNGIQPAALPMGDLEAQDPLEFLEQPLSQEAVVEDGRIKMVFLPAALDILQVDDLFFRITLQETAALGQNEIDLSGAPLEEMGVLLGSFTRIERSGAPPDPYPGWKSYINVDHGFSVRYPPDWTAEELQVELVPAVSVDAVLLRYEDAALMLAHYFDVNYVPRDVGFPGGLLVDEGQVAFLGQQIDKLVLQYGGKDKSVLYNGLEAFQAGGVAFQLSLQDSRAGVGYDELEVSDALQLEAELILSTVRQFPAALSPSPASLISEGVEFFLTFDSCFDLDEGMQVSLEDGGCDFLVGSANGGGLRIEFQPQAPAVFGLDGVFVEEPQISQCAGLAGMSAQAETIAPLDSYHICYQTSAGRYGYLIFRALTSDGVSFDWQTFSTAGPLQVNASQGNAGITRRDVSVPDGTVFAPGEEFEKTWQLQNTGTTTWTTDYAIRFHAGERMGAPFEVVMPQQVPPGGTVNISVPMVAPQEPGEYRGDWLLRDAQGRTFGVGNNETFWVIIVVEREEETEEEETGQEEEDVVIETTLSVDPVTYTGACPATLTVNFSISTEGADRYTYELQAGATQAGFQFFLPDPTEVTLASSGPNTKSVAYTLTMQNSVEGWLQLVVTDPGEHLSQKVNFTVNCE